MGAAESTSTQGHEEAAEEEFEVFAGASRADVMHHVCAPRAPLFLEPQAQQKLLDGQRRELSPERVILEPCTVILHVYDLNETLQAANEVMAFSIQNVAMGGAFHVGLEAFGSEWSYGSAGVMCEPPRTVEGHVYRCSVVLGQTTLIQWVTEVHDMCQTWFGDDYRMFNHNCCSFAAELVHRLGVQPIPSWVDRFSRILQHGHGRVRAASEATEGLLNQLNQQIKDQLKASVEPAHCGTGVTLTLPHSQIVVQGQTVSLEPAANLQHGCVAPQAPTEMRPDSTGSQTPVFISWSDDAPVLSTSPKACLQTPGIAHKQDSTAEDFVESLPRMANLEQVYRQRSHAQDTVAEKLLDEIAKDHPLPDFETTSGFASAWQVAVAREVADARDAVVADEISKLPLPAAHAPCDTVVPDMQAKENFEQLWSSVARGIDAEKLFDESAENVGAAQPLPDLHPHGESIKLEANEQAGNLISKRRFPPALASCDSAVPELEAMVEVEDIAWSPALSHPPGNAAVRVLVEDNVEDVDSKLAGDEEVRPSHPDVIEETARPLEEKIKKDSPRSTFPSLQVPAEAATPGHPSGIAVFPVGAMVDYYSVSHRGWGPAQVLDFDPSSGLYNLSCKPHVPHHKIRARLCQVSQVGLDPQGPPRLDVNMPDWLPPGTSVEYESTSAQECWIPTMITAYHPASGLYDLDCKLQVHRLKIRRLDNFPVGADIEYRSISAGQWIPGRVLSFDAGSGLYDLSCKKMVARGQMRWPTQSSGFKSGALAFASSA